MLSSLDVIRELIANGTVVTPAYYATFIDDPQTLNLTLCSQLLSLPQYLGAFAADMIPPI